MTEELVLQWLREVQHPGREDKDIVSLGMVADVEIAEAKIVVTLAFPKRPDPLKNYLVGAAQAAIYRNAPGGTEVEVKTIVKDPAKKTVNELNLDQVKYISERIAEEQLTGPSGRPVRLEMFVHGALCMAVSGKCYLSLHHYGASANRGACFQVCRRGYEVTDLETGQQLHLGNKYIMSPRDICTIEFLDKMVESGVRVFKIEGRARSAEYVKRCASCYRRAADAICEGRFSPELAVSLKAELEEVFNRGFWDGWYQGAELGQWSEVYGNRSSHRKVYCGKVANWFDRIGVAEIAVECVDLHRGDEVMAIGRNTGVVEFRVDDLRVELEPADIAGKGVRCSVAVRPEGDWPGRLHRGDKLYIWEKV